MEPQVSEPMPTAAKLAAMPAGSELIDPKVGQRYALAAAD
jgi:hypothetical protein